MNQTTNVKSDTFHFGLKILAHNLKEHRKEFKGVLKGVHT